MLAHGFVTVRLTSGNMNDAEGERIPAFIVNRR
jgi:hypothetical protein